MVSARNISTYFYHRFRCFSFSMHLGLTCLPSNQPRHESCLSFQVLTVVRLIFNNISCKLRGKSLAVVRLSSDNIMTLFICPESERKHSFYGSDMSLLSFFSTLLGLIVVKTEKEKFVDSTLLTQFFTDTILC